MSNFKIRSALISVAARLGAVSNYTDIAGTGRQTMLGTGKVYKDMWLPAAWWWGQEPDQFANAYGGTTAVTGSPGTAAPMQGYFGKATNASPALMPVLSSSLAKDTDGRAAICFIAPPDADTTGNVSATLYYSYPAALSTAGSMQVWRLHYAYLGTKATAATAGVSGSILYGASSLTTGSGKLEVQTLGNIPSFNVAASPFVMLELGLEGSDASSLDSAPTEKILGMRLRYVANALGAAV